MVWWHEPVLQPDDNIALCCYSCNNLRHKSKVCPYTARAARAHIFTDYMSNNDDTLPTGDMSKLDPELGHSNHSYTTIVGYIKYRFNSPIKNSSQHDYSDDNRLTECTPPWPDNFHCWNHQKKREGSRARAAQSQLQATSLASKCDNTLAHRQQCWTAPQTIDIVDTP